jgi:hypothetical protein
MKDPELLQILKDIKKLEAKIILLASSRPKCTCKTDCIGGPTDLAEMDYMCSPHPGSLLRLSLTTIKPMARR